MTAADASGNDGASVRLSKKTTLDLTTKPFGAPSRQGDAQIDVQRLRTECSLSFLNPAYGL